MKALKITFEYGRVWTVETSDGRAKTGASVQSALSKLFDANHDGYDAIAGIFETIPDSGGSGQIARGQASG